MSIPEQVQRQLDDAAVLRQQLVPNDDDAANTPTAVEAVSDGASSNAAPADQTPATRAEAQPSEHADDPKMVQRYRTLQGMYNGLDARYREALSHIDQMREALAQVQTAAPSAVTTVTPGGGAVSDPITPKELEDYTPEFFAMMDRWLAPRLNRLGLEIERRVSQAVQPLATTVQTVAQQSARTAEEQFFDELTRVVPDWEQVNDSAGFIEWLAVADPMSAVTKQVYLNDARQKLDVRRVASIFNAYKQASGIAEPVSTSRRQSVAAQATVAPRRNSSDVPTGKDKIVTSLDLRKLYDDKRRGLYNGRDAEFRQLESELVAAINQGRYQP